MSFDLSRLLKIHRFDTLRRLPALEVMFEASMGLGLDALNQEVAGAIRYEVETLKLEERYRPGDRRLHGLLAPTLEGVLLKRLKSLSELLGSHRLLHGEESVEGRAAKLLVRTVLPRGLQGLTNRAFADTQRLIGRRLERLRKEPALGEAVAVLRLERVFEDFEELNRRFGREIGSNAAQAVSTKEIRARRARGQDRFSRIIFRAIGLFPGEDRADTVKRDALLAGVYRENEVLAREAKARAQRARRRRARGSGGSGEASTSASSS